MMISKILIIADPSREGLDLVVDVLQTIQKQQPRIKIIFVSSLSEFLSKNLGPNILNLLQKEEKETIERAVEYFTSLDIPYQFEVISTQALKTIFDEIKMGDQEMIIVQGEFIKLCGEDNMNQRFISPTDFNPKCPILLIDETKTPTWFKQMNWYEGLKRNNIPD